MVAFLALVVAVVLGWSPLVPVAVALVGGTYAVELAIDDARLVALGGVAAVVVAGGLLVLVYAVRARGLALVLLGALAAAAVLAIVFVAARTQSRARA